MRLASLLVVVLLSLTGAPGSARAALELVDAGPVGDTVRGDGVRYIASASTAGPTGSPVTVLDTGTGARRAIPTPAGCHFVDIHRGTLLWTCAQTPSAYAFTAYNSGVTYDLASGAVTALAPPPSTPSGPEAGVYQGIGDRWARVEFSGYHYDFAAYVDRVTGVTAVPDPTDRQIADPDHYPLVRQLCAGQLRPYVPDDVNPAGGVTLGDLATAGPRAADTTYAVDGPGRVELERCGAKPRTLRLCRAPVFCSQPVIGGHLVAWVESNEPAGAFRSARLVVRSLASGRVESLRSRTTVTPLLVGQRLYIVDAGRLRRVTF